MLSLSAWRWHGLVALCSTIWTLACAVSSGHPGRKNVPRQPQHPCAHPYEEPVAAVKQLALGCDINARQVAPASSSIVLIWYHVDVRSKRLGKALARACVSGSSLLSVPGVRGVYLVSAGLLYSVDPRTGQRTLVRMRAPQPRWRLSHLLGFARESSRLQILTVMIDDRAREALWLFTIENGSASGAPYQTLELGSNVSALATRFVFPRCASDYEQCLVVRRDSGLDITPSRGQSLESLLGAGQMHVIDAVWTTVTRKAATAALLVAGGCGL